MNMPSTKNAALVVLLLMLCCNTIIAQPVSYPLNIYPDSKFAPFVYGVASGDPLEDRIILWTKIQVADTTIEAYNLKWQIADDAAFSSIINEGNLFAEKKHDYTAKVDATGLSAGSDYFYRFMFEDKTSQTGKAKTLPKEEVEHLKIAVASCSSIWSGYFNAYRRIAERKDIDFVVHLGDYAYDYPDKDELVRVIESHTKDVASLAEWRERHAYYLLDPDLRAAKQNKTWIAIWDNHDTDCEKPGTQAEAIQAFYEYLPIRMPDTSHPERLYRSFRFGNLAQLNMIDMFLFKGKEVYAENQKSILGNHQDAWLKNQLSASTSTWNLIGNQEMMGSWLSSKSKVIKLPGNGTYFDSGNWDGYAHDRKRLFDFIKDNTINNVVVLTGDAHMSFVIDLTTAPRNKKVYNRKTGEGAVGVEFLPTSISRGNMDESGIPKEFIPLFQSISKGWNPQHRFCQFSKHGYGTLDITKERCVAEFWYSPILSMQDVEFFGRGYTVKNGVNHWERKFNKRRSKSTFP